MAVNLVTQWWRAEPEIDRLRAENDELRAQVESQSRLIADCVGFQRRMKDVIADCVEFQRRMKDEAQRVANISLILLERIDELRDIELRLCDISTVLDGKKVRP